MSHSIENSQSPEEQFTQLLPALMHDIAPDIGYKVDLVGVPLEKAFGKAAVGTLEANLGATLEGTADFTYSYQPRTDTIEPTVLRFPLQRRIMNSQRAQNAADKEVLADCIYLQKWEGGYIQSYGLGTDTIAPVNEGVREHSLAAIDGFLTLGDLATLPKDHWSQPRISERLELSSDWVVRDQKVIPLPADPDAVCNQIIITRKRAVLTAPDDPTLHKDDYEVTLARILPSPYPDALFGEKAIDEETLQAHENDASGRTTAVVETRYLRYDSPAVPDLPEIFDEQTATRSPEDADYRYFLEVLGAYAADIQKSA